jgi:hypothetical protein
MIVRDQAGRLLLDIVAAGISQITLELFGPDELFFFEDDTARARPYITLDEALELYNVTGEADKARKLKKAIQHLPN